MSIDWSDFHYPLEKINLEFMMTYVPNIEYFDLDTAKEIANLRDYEAAQELMDSLREGGML